MKLKEVFDKRLLALIGFFVFAIVGSELVNVPLTGIDAGIFSVFLANMIYGGKFIYYYIFIWCMLAKGLTIVFSLVLGYISATYTSEFTIIFFATLIVFFQIAIKLFLYMYLENKSVEWREKNNVK